MSNIQIISDGALDLSPELCKEKDIRVVPFYVSFDGEHYYKEIEEIGIRDFYQRMVDDPKTFPKSSLPAIQDYYDVFEEYAKQNIPMICICITRKFSGSQEAALNARTMILEEYPDAKIEVIDSIQDTVLQGLYVQEACRARDLGWDFDRIVARLLEIRESGRIFFTVGSIDYLAHGGRIGKLASLAGGALKIQPLITLREGEIFPSGITRNRRKAMQKVVDMTAAYLDEVKAKPGEYAFCIGYGYDMEEPKVFREMLADMIRTRLGIDEIPLYQIVATISVHTGPYPLGVSIVKRADYDVQ